MYLIYLSILYLVIILIIIKISHKLNLFDQPNGRKIHFEKVPNSCGYALIIFFLIISKTTEIVYEIDQILIMSFFVFLAGAIDDYNNFKPTSKLVLIIIPVFLLVQDGFTIHNLGTYEYLGLISLGKFALPFTILCIGLLINAVNYNDGIDGSCILQTIISIVYLLFLNKDNQQIVEILYIILIPLCISFLFNLTQNKKLKIFLGDGGSLQLGFICSFLIIYSFNYENIHPSFLIWSVAYVVYEFLTVSTLRLVKKKNLFEPNTDHYHHHLVLKKKYSHTKSTLIIGAISISLIILGWLTTLLLGKLFSLLFFILTFFIYFFLRIKFTYNV